jgi:hypothetical protein
MRCAILLIGTSILIGLVKAESELPHGRSVLLNDYAGTSQYVQTQETFAEQCTSSHQTIIETYVATLPSCLTRDLELY